MSLSDEAAWSNGIDLVERAARHITFATFVLAKIQVIRNLRNTPPAGNSAKTFRITHLQDRGWYSAQIEQKQLCFSAEKMRKDSSRCPRRCRWKRNCSFRVSRLWSLGSSLVGFRHRHPARAEFVASRNHVAIADWEIGVPRRLAD